MSATINLKKGVDLPVWEWMRFGLTPTQIGGQTAPAAVGSSRYL